MSFEPGRFARERTLEEPYEGVPEHLWDPLWDWCCKLLLKREIIEDVGIHLRIPLRRDGRHSHQTWCDSFKVQCAESDEFMLTLVEVLLDRWGTAGRAWLPLHELLEKANSIYEVDDDLMLVYRVAPEIKQQVEQTVGDTDGSVRRYLEQAWQAAYARTADEEKAYSKAIKAVEAAARPIISPKDADATLSKMIGAVNDKPEKWTFALDAKGKPVENALAMMRLLNDGQRERHGRDDPAPKQTVEEARTAVHLAATLVQFFTSGAFTTGVTQPTAQAAATV